MARSLPVARFTTEALPAQARFDAWHKLVSPVFEPRPASDDTHLNVAVQATASYLGSAAVMHTRANAQGFTRTQRLIAAEGMDHYLIQVYQRGVCDGTYGEVSNTVRPGDIKVIDLARPFNTMNTDFENTTLILPRTVLAPLLADPDGLHGRVLGRDTALGRLLASYLQTLAASSEELSLPEGAELAAITARLVATCLGGNRRAREESRASGAATAGQAVRAFIDQSLGQPWLGPETIMRHFAMSRTQLYRLFAEEGGVAAYILSRRLNRCFAVLVDPASASRGIGRIAFDHGFASEAHFSRSFRRAFGMTPSEARAGAGAARAAEAAGGNSFLREWMRGMRPGFGDPRG